MPDARPDQADKQTAKVFCITFAFILTALLGLSGCSEKDHEHKRDQGDTHDVDAAHTGDKVVHVYKLRGRIVSLPDPTDPVTEFKVHHEAIDDFKVGDGSLAPMKAMTMPFTPGDDVDIQSLAVGDAITFEFHMEWEPTRSMTATAIQKLPADTKLSFESAGDQSADHAGR